MSEIRLNIDGREVVGFEGQTLLEVARQNGITIPTLCHDDRVKAYGSCGICVVEAENSPKLLRSCSTLAAEGMIIKTNTERVRKSRKTALELLMSDHVGDCRPPCVLACPAQTDCQGYVGLIANGEYHEALRLVKDKIPLPGSIGRICPHPCETACRRQMVEEPISIAALKQFAADRNMEMGELYTHEVGEPSGKSVAIIGGGPGGLSAAYFLRTMGHAVTVYDGMPQMGGMLRYGIPEYRLPKSYLQAEIDAIESMGVTMKNNIKVGRDITLQYLRNSFDAVIVAVGAWTSTSLRCPGEELDGVLGGIDFLRDVALNNPVFTGRRIAVVGGGNTAMDACRTSIRLGASKVYNIYRRTRNEMPAEEVEITEAEEEGVIFKNLTNPIEVIGQDGRVKAMRLQIMELGEPDASGRRAPVPVEGKEETIEIDAVVVAIGQKTDPVGLDGVALTRWGTVSADEHTFLTSLDGVFAIGDATNKGADIAIAAIGEAKRAAAMVDKFLLGEQLSYKETFLVKTQPTAEDFADREKAPRTRMPHRKPDERKHDFLEVNLGLSPEEAKREANRCLECGCHDYFECKLIELANEYTVKPEKFAGKQHLRRSPTQHPHINRNPDKCILCGLCVRICDQVVGATALGLVGRGFDTIIKPALDVRLEETDCISCGQCVSACPTGALTETLMIPKQVPVCEKHTVTTCGFCSVGCQQKLGHTGNLITRALPCAENERDALLCVKGRFGLEETSRQERLTAPLIRRESGLEAVSFEEAVIYTNKSLQSLQTQYGKDCVAVAISDSYTNEEVTLIKKYANDALKTSRVFSFARTPSGLADVLGRDASTATLDEMENTQLIVVVASDLMTSHAVAGMRIRRAVERGAKLLMLSDRYSLLDDIATMKLNAGEDFLTLVQIIKAMLDSGCNKAVENAGELESLTKGIAVDESAKNAAEMITRAGKAVFVFDKQSVTRQGAGLIGDIAVLSGHENGPRNGIVQLLPGANSQGLSNLGIESGEDCLRSIAAGEIRGLFIFGDYPPEIDLGTVDFLAVQELHMTATAMAANVIFPAASFAEVSGSFTGADGMVRQVVRAIDPVSGWDNAAQVMALSAGAGFPIEVTPKS